MWQSLLLFSVTVAAIWLTKRLRLRPLCRGRWRYLLAGVVLGIGLEGVSGDVWLWLRRLHFFHRRGRMSFCRKVRFFPCMRATQLSYSFWESMKYDATVVQMLDGLGVFYKKIYAAATGTDVSLPLLLNGLDNPLQLSVTNETNLFRLARRAGFETAFVSVQTPKSLRYIAPFLQREQIDHYRSYTKAARRERYDMLLLESLREIYVQRKQFIVLHQIGAHSPYIYFPGEKSDDAAENYRRSLRYSFELYEKVIAFLKRHDRPFVLLYTSDHGEFTGEGGRFGHNVFDNRVYEVPMFITANVPLPASVERIRSHLDLSLFVRYLLGYGERFTPSAAPVVVNGTMQSREDGFIMIGE